MLFVRAGRLSVTIAGFLPARAKYFLGGKKRQCQRLFVYKFAVEMLSRCSGTAGREPFQLSPEMVDRRVPPGTRQLHVERGQVSQALFQSLPSAIIRV
jgi:hypothetical protein